MGKYFQTKIGTLESSVLDLWQEAAEKDEELSAKQKKIDVDGDGEIEGSDLAKLRKKKDKKEDVDEQEIADEKKKKIHANYKESWEDAIGGVMLNEAMDDLYETIVDMSDEEFDALLEEADKDPEIYEGILGAIGRGLKKAGKRFGTAQGRADAKLKKAQGKEKLAKTRQATIDAKAGAKQAKKALKQKKKDANIGVVNKARTAAKAVGRGAKKVGGAVKSRIKKSAEEVEDNSNETLTGKKKAVVELNPKDEEDKSK